MVLETPGYRRSLPVRVCPKCGSVHVHRSRRRMVEKWMNWVHINQRIYRCYRCQHRFWDNHTGPSRYTLSPSDLNVIGPGDASPQMATYKTTSPEHGQHPRGKRRGRRSTLHRFQEWLYRKHNLTIGTLILLIMLAALVLTGFWWAMDTWI